LRARLHGPLETASASLSVEATTAG